MASAIFSMQASTAFSSYAIYAFACGTPNTNVLKCIALPVDVFPAANVNPTIAFDTLVLKFLDNGGESGELPSLITFPGSRLREKR